MPATTDTWPGLSIELVKLNQSTTKIPKIASVASLPMRDVSQGISDLKIYDVVLASTPNLKASFRAVT